MERPAVGVVKVAGVQRQRADAATAADHVRVFAAFVVYATWRAFVGRDYYAAPYLSPFYSPCLSTDCVQGSSDFGQPFERFRRFPLGMFLVHPVEQRQLQFERVNQLNLMAAPFQLNPLPGNVDDSATLSTPGIRRISLANVRNNSPRFAPSSNTRGA